MKTATMTASMNFDRSHSRSSLMKYLPHIVIAALLFALLLAASQNGPTIPAVNSSLTHLGQH